MRTIIAGSRDFTDYALMKTLMETIDWNPSAILSGAARGADTLGEKWAAEMGVNIERFPAQWSALGKSAGYIRNQTMANHAEALVAFHLNGSRGTKHMINIAREKGLKIKIFYI